MPTTTLNPASNQTPDATLGGVAVTGPTNTGHSSTLASASGAGGAQSKSCRWFSFPAVSAFGILSVTLKIDHTSSGSLTGDGAGNEFLLQYSINGGGSWITAVQRDLYTASQGPTTFSVALSIAQNLTQVQVRDLLDVVTVDVGETASATATIANIKIEVVTAIQNQLLVMM
jgi:hypothetical protein